MIDPTEINRRRDCWSRGYWEIPDNLDTSSFDFSWRPSPLDRPYIHQFGTQWQKTGGPRFIVPENEGVKYQDCQRAIRLPNKEDRAWRMIADDIEMDYSWHHDDTEPPFTYVFGNQYYTAREMTSIQYNVKGSTRYKYLDYPKANLAVTPLDIIFLSNGEEIADTNYTHLLAITKGLPNRIVRIDGIKGRVNSQYAAAETSSTPWYFLVNAKLRVDPLFNFGWQPNRSKKDKHYIFRATNPVNGLIYGHMAIVANNKRVTLSTIADGLDFTMSGPHELVDMNSGIAHFNISPWDAWRTAFREVIKIKFYSHTNRSGKEASERLRIWTTVATGDNSEWCLRGSNDAVEYYDSVEGGLDRLMLSYDWEWLKSYYDHRYNK